MKTINKFFRIRQQYLLGNLGLLIFTTTSYAQLFLFDFGRQEPAIEYQTGGNWNNIVGAQGHLGEFINLVDSTGQVSSLTLEITNSFNNFNTNGVMDGTVAATAGYPSTAYSDSLFINTGTFADFADDGQAEFVISGLDSNFAYDFSFYASRNSVGDNRETQYTVSGVNSDLAFLDTANNSTEFAYVMGIMPNASNEIIVNVAFGPNNSNASKFAYLGVMEINTVAVPEPSTYALVIGLFILSSLFIRRRFTETKL